MGLRIGIGYDVHAFAKPEDHRLLVIGGVVFDHDRGLAGHSDADVLTHAVADALLGAARLGDIGEYFPDNDIRYLGADSIGLLGEVAKLVSDAGYRIIDVDCVVSAQQPRVSPHKEAMRARLAQALGLGVDAVGIKATTTEGLGAIGRSEGIAATAVALLETV
ncbi:MAG: 2-C-methyl-D-erythritol 2,4-cyclodiphosphate synthase [Coriobacteriia bacterium]|nr:2-C-methyl-D-erythritol 2,4-cyclodiphosphate synthase [Coriobacteriia bacterium]MCL2136664.1 2-C-methyl-D-erythritol 2,4-cyclodiphosphate synthase [Coriobacteriia bacterium]